MKIVEYDDADPVGVLRLNLLSLGWPLTPELAAHPPPRPTPVPVLWSVRCKDGIIAGQMMVTEVIHSPFAKLLEWTPSSGYCSQPQGSARGLFSIIETTVRSGIRPLLESSGSDNLFYSLIGVNFTQN